VDDTVYNPAVLSCPICGDIDQVTATLLVPVTDAVNCCVCDAVRFTLAGLRETLTGGAGGMMVTNALADLLVSATLLAVT